MKLHYYRTTANFGDVLNLQFWQKALGKNLSEVEDSETRFIGIGTMLMDNLDDPFSTNLIAGAGAGYHNSPKFLGKWYFAFVRGPLTAKLLGLPEEIGVGDPAYIVDEIFNISPCQSRSGVIFVPHCDNDLIYQWSAICRCAGVRYVSPSRPPEEVIREIASAKMVITESMHGAIIADSLRVPWIPIRIGNNILEFKWEDFCSTINIKHKFEKFDPPIVGRKLLIRPDLILSHSLKLRRIMKVAKPRLSENTVSMRTKEKIRMRIHSLRKALRGDWKRCFKPFSESISLLNND